MDVLTIAVIIVVVVALFVVLGRLMGGQLEHRERSGENLWGSPRHGDDEKPRRG